MKSKPAKTPPFLYKVTSSADWSASQKQKAVKLGTIDKEFIHLSMLEQLAHVLDKYWRKDLDCMILQLDVEKLQGRLVKERNPGGTTEYYHLYDGAILLDAVVKAFHREDLGV